MTEPVQLVSDSLSKGLSRIFRAGGLALIRPVVRAQRLASKEKQTVDAIQLAAIDLVRIVRSLQALAFKNAEGVLDVVEKVEQIRPLVRAIPVIGGVLDNPAVERSSELSRLIVATTKGSEKIITDVEDALVNVDAKSLRPYLRELRSLTVKVDELLVTQLRFEPAD